MKDSLLDQLHLINPWLKNKDQIWKVELFFHRTQLEFLVKKSWDDLCTVLVGPRQAGKTTLGFYICNHLITQKRFLEVIYLNCDFKEIRDFLKSPSFVKELCDHFSLERSIFFIDEVQRLKNPGLLLKSLIDLKLPHKILASGSSQLEIKSKVTEHLTGREIESIILPMSYQEYINYIDVEKIMLFGAYPQIIKKQEENKYLLKRLYENYVNKDIIEFLKIGEPDSMQNLISLIAHQSGQLVNYQQLSIDCQMSVHKVRNYLTILEQTYVIAKLKPFVGNKRTEVTSNPIIYFLDNGFRNQALNNFFPLHNRSDEGLLVESFVFQEILKLKFNHHADFNIYYWRTKSGAEIDFILQGRELVPIEVKYKNFEKVNITKSFRSFIDAYSPKNAFILTKNFNYTVEIKSTKIYFFSVKQFSSFIDKVANFLI